MGAQVSNIFKDLTEDGNRWDVNTIAVPTHQDFLSSFAQQEAPRILIAPIGGGRDCGPDQSVADQDDDRGAQSEPVVCLSLEQFLSSAQQLKEEREAGWGPFYRRPQQMVLHSTPVDQGRGSRPKSKNLWTPLQKVRSLQRTGLLLTEDRLRELHTFLPVSTRLANCWKLIYSPSVHGVSLQTFYRQSQRWPGETLLLAKDHNGVVFGGFASHTWRASFTNLHYGAPTCFVFAFNDEREEPEIFPWAGGDAHFMYSDNDGFGMGGGSGFAFWINKDLLHGHSEPSPTFATSRPLTSKSEFVMLSMECWIFDSVPDEAPVEALSNGTLGLSPAGLMGIQEEGSETQESASSMAESPESSVNCSPAHSRSSSPKCRRDKDPEKQDDSRVRTMFQKFSDFNLMTAMGV